MQWLASLCVRRPVFAAVLMLVIFVVGTAGYFKLGLDWFPKIDFPVNQITTRLDGAAPEEVESEEISQKVEEAVNTISGIDELKSVSVEERVAGAGHLPASTRTSTSPPRTCATT